MDDVELPELPESTEEERKEKRKDHLNTLVAITVTLIVTFMAFCKIHDNNTVLKMEQAEAARGDKWSWYQSLNVRQDLDEAKLLDLKDDLETENDPERKKRIGLKTADYQALTAKIAEKKQKVKNEAEAEEKRYDQLNEVHEDFDHTEAAISIAVSLLAMTTLLQKRWMYVVAMVPAIIGIYSGIMGLCGGMAIP